MMFFEDYDGVKYPASAIRWISGKRKRERYPFCYHLVSLGKDETCEVSPDTVTELTQATVALIPAERGTSVIDIADNLGDVWKTPVLGWAIGADGGVRPVTPRGINDDYMPEEVTPLVEMPNGSILGPDSYFSNARELLDDRRKARDHAPFHSAYSRMRSAQRSYTEEENTQAAVDELYAAKTELLSIESQTRGQILLKLLALRDVVSQEEFGKLLDQAEASLNHVR